MLKTRLPVPVSSVTAPSRFELLGVARKVATPAPRPETPVLIGRPVAFVSVPPDGVPSAPPLTTNAPAEPVFTASAVATPVPRPEIPVDTGSPVALDRLAKDGVPMFGVVSTGLVLNTRFPVPVSSEMTPASCAEVVAA